MEEAEGKCRERWKEKKTSLKVCVYRNLVLCNQLLMLQLVPTSRFAAWAAVKTTEEIQEGGRRR
jgi:hypothetical protein